jgi:hypothetical protein
MKPIDAVIINGDKYPCKTEYDAVIYILSVLDIYSPFVLFKENIIGACSFVKEHADSRYVKSKMTRTIEHFRRIRDKRKLVTEYYNLVLSLEGIGLLGGFLVQAPIQKGDTGYNPERRTISDTLYKENKHQIWDEKEDA